MSYLDFYGLTRAPFNVTPDPDFLYLSPSHKEALATFLYGVSRRKGILAVTGEVGVGKTTVLRSYLEQVTSDNIKLIYLFNANMPFSDLVRTLCEELQCIQGERDSDLLNDLQHALVREYSEGRNVVLIIDEAQNIPYDTLENLRMLSNLETRTDKLLQIVLIGQPELQEKLNEHRLRQLRQRIAVRSTIVPLTTHESMEYIANRLNKCGITDPESVFTARAMHSIVKTAGGIPRVINILCDNALITGYGYQKRPIDRAVVKEVEADFFGSPEKNYRPWAISTALVAVILFAIWFVLRDVPQSAIADVPAQSPISEAATGPVAIPSEKEPPPVYETAIPPTLTETKPDSNRSGLVPVKNRTRGTDPPRRAEKGKKQTIPTPAKPVSERAAANKKQLDEKIALERARKIQLLVQNLSKQSAQQIRSLSRQKKPVAAPSLSQRETDMKPSDLKASSTASGSLRNTPAATDQLPDQETGQPVAPKRADAASSREPSRIVLSRVPPVIVRTVKPQYPRSGIVGRLEGTVFLKVLVTERGEVEAVQVLRGIGGNSAFSDSATAAVKQWKFTPGTLNGIKQKMWVTCAIAYHLKERQT